jgi:hypothetical protein
VPVTHNEACLRRQEALAEFEKAWPNACHTCGGAGGLSTPGTREQPPDFDVCACIEDGKCPRCAAPIVFEEHDYAEYGKCAACGWDDRAIILGTQPAITRPEVDCLCFLEEPDPICVDCGKPIPFSDGCADGMPDHCSACWNVAHGLTPDGKRRKMTKEAP